MSTIAELEVAADVFALAATFDLIPEAEFEVERVVAYDRKRLLPFVWVTAADHTHEQLADALAADPSVDNVELLTDLGDEWLYRMDLVDAIDFLVHLLDEEQATVMAAFGERDRWLLRILFPDRDSLSRSYDFCEEQGVALEVTSIYELDEQRHGQFGLTKDQHESLVTASKLGYYNVPRGATLSEVADELGISHQALSERLRRGHGRLVDNALVIGPESDDAFR